MIWVNKEIEKKNANAEYVGLVHIREIKFSMIFQDNLEQMVKSGYYKNKFWLETFNKLHNEGIVINSFNINGDKNWQEIDFYLDIKKAKDLIKLDVSNKNY